MKPSAVLVNVARGEIVDEDALYARSPERRSPARPSTSGTDIRRSRARRFPSRRPFHELPNVLMTPHVSGWTEGMLEARAKLIAENIQRTARGEPPLNLIR